MTANGYTPIIGWLRETEQTPVELASSNVAGPPQSVSDQPGDIDVIWRGCGLEPPGPGVSQPDVADPPVAITLGNAASNSRRGVAAAGPGGRLLGGQLG